MVPLTICISGDASMMTRLATSSTSAMRPIGIDAGASVSVRIDPQDPAIVALDAYKYR